MGIPKELRGKIAVLVDFLLSDSGVHLILFMTYTGKSVSYIPGTAVQTFEHPYELLIPLANIQLLWGIIGMLNFLAAFYRKTWFTSGVFALTMAYLFVWGLGYSLSNNVYLSNLGALHIGFMSMTILAVIRGRRGVLTDEREDADGLTVN